VLPGIRYPEIMDPGDELLDMSFVLPDAAIAQLAAPPSSTPAS
jgi:hypothetical protein